MDKARIAAALSILISSKSFTATVKQVKDIIDNWETRPLLFAGKLEPLNSLVDVGLQKPEALDKLVELAMSKRRQVPLAKRADYQRDLMAQRRERANKAVQLEELVRGAKMSAADREAYRRSIQARWMSERNKYIASKGNLSWKERNTASSEFWSKLDATLDKDLMEAKAVLDRPPVKRKRVVKVEKPTPNTALGKAFTKAKAKAR